MSLIPMLYILVFLIGSIDLCFYSFVHDCVHCCTALMLTNYLNLGPFLVIPSFCVLPLASFSKLICLNFIIII